jgi:hypothetical protein
MLFITRITLFSTGLQWLRQQSGHSIFECGVQLPFSLEFRWIIEITRATRARFTARCGEVNSALDSVNISPALLQH